MRSSFARLTITRLRYPATTDQGVEIVDYDDDPEESDITGCWYEPTTSTENRDGREAVRTGYTVDAPAGIDLTERDRVRIAGAVHEVDGRPRAIPSPTGALESTLFNTKLWEG